MSIEPPREDVGRAIFRAAAEQAVELVPVAGGMLTALFKVTHPSTLERELTQWRGTVSTTLNSQDTRLTALERQQRPTIVLSQVAVDLGLWLVRTDEGRWPSPHDHEALRTAFSSIPVGALKEAVSELQELGLVEIEQMWGRDNYQVTATWPLYWLFAPMGVGATPVADAMAVADVALGLEDAWLSAERVREAMGWDERRVNSAMTMLLRAAPGAMKSDEVHQRYAITRIYVDASARMKLRRFRETAQQGGVPAPSANLMP
jgi:hypothetical protein